MKQLKTEVKGGVRISTVELPAWARGGGLPFETCVFWHDTSEVTKRYETPEKARAGHAQWVALAEDLSAQGFRAEILGEEDA